jgi:hypothetical protein
MASIRPTIGRCPLSAVAALLLALLQSACTTAVPAAVGARAVESNRNLQGSVRFGTSRVTQAYGVRDVAVAATVSIIDMTTSETIATTLTDASARFIFAADVTGKLAVETPYILEAIKGLSSNAAGDHRLLLHEPGRHHPHAWNHSGIDHCQFRGDRRPTAHRPLCG